MKKIVINSYTMYISKSIWAPPDIEIFNNLVKYLNSQDFDVTVKKVSSFVLKLYPFLKKKWKFSEAFAFIQNNNNGYFYVLNFDVNVTAFDKKLRGIVLDRRCKVFLKAQYREGLYNKYPFTKIKPWIFFDANPSEMQSQIKKLRKVKRIYKSLYFRGRTDYKRREHILKYLKRRSIINPDSSSVSYKQYLKESCEYKIILSLPGWGNFCHREIEGFGLGTPVLMPRLKNSLHNDLIPDYHYISVDVDTETVEFEYIAEKIEERFYKVIDDYEYLDFIAGNAMQWYDENVRHPNSMELTTRFLGLIKPT